MKETPTTERKLDHVRISLDRDVRSTHNFWDDVHLDHNALPEVDYSDISLEGSLFNVKVKAPLVISGMTGGHPRLARINSNLAEAAERFGIAMGVGSQRAALRSGEARSSYTVVRDHDIPLRIANIGAPQLIPQKGDGAAPLTMDDCRDLMDMIDAHVLAVHLNYLQEDIQPEGERNAEGVLQRIAEISSELPVIVKETGAGISRSVADRLLKGTKVIGVDVGGLSGTSFSAVEHYRASERKDPAGTRLGRTLWDWGIPTPIAVLNAVHAGFSEVIATGGIRHGLDAARSLALGARCAGLARILLEPAMKSADAVMEELQMICTEVRTVMHLTGTRDLSGFADSRPMLLGRCGEMLARGSAAH